MTFMMTFLITISMPEKHHESNVGSVSYDLAVVGKDNLSTFPRWQVS